MQDYCKEVILHFRDLAGLKKERQTAHYRQEKRKLYHFMISKVLAEFDAIRKEGGISVEYQGSTIKLWPAVLFVITDEIEAQLLSLMTTCRFCSASKAERSDVSGELFACKNYGATESFRKQQMRVIAARARGTVQTARDALTNAGLCNVALGCAEIDMPMGDHPSKWYGMIPPDRMHLWWEGMAKHFVTWMVQLIEKNNDEGLVNGTEKTLDEMLMGFNCKHSDKSIPTRHFHGGISNLAKIPAKHMVPLLVQMQVIVGCSDTFVTATQKDTINDIIATFIALAGDLHVDAVSESHLECLRASIHRCNI